MMWCCVEGVQVKTCWNFVSIVVLSLFRFGTRRCDERM